MDLKKHIRDIPDFPKKGILFHDVTTLFKSPEAFSFAIDQLLDKIKGLNPNYIAGIEARGFIIGGILANRLNCGFIPIRKPGKLPAEVISESYELEYGSDTVEMHKDALQAGDRVVIVDDLVATGGTLLAGAKLVEQTGAEIVAVASIIDMPDLGGRQKLQSYPYFYLLEYLGD